MQNDLAHSPGYSSKVRLALILSVFWISGFIGFLYETAFYYINNGGLTRRGNCFGPWISIYCFGGLLVYAACRKISSRPAAVILLSGALCSILELLTGWILHRFFAMRLWDYSSELWNFGNIGGYICLRSVLLFSASGLFIFYGIVPLLLRLNRLAGSRLFFFLMITVSLLCILDIVYNYCLADLFGTMDASAYYAGTGRYMFVPDYSPGSR